MTSDQYPKSRQLARGERRYRRKVASPKQWAAIRAEKIDGQLCRLIGVSVMAKNPYGCPCHAIIEAHHIVKRGAPFFGDDVADNIIPLCRFHHDLVTFSPGGESTRAIAYRLSDAEYAYVVGRLGEDGMRRLFGV